MAASEKSLQNFLNHDCRIGVVGLGYVGLPLALAFERYFSVIGFDISVCKIQNLRNGVDDTNEVGNERLAQSTVEFTDQAEKLSLCDFVIVAVPTPIDQAKNPDLSPVIKATELIAQNLKPGAIIVFESTVYPGVTEEICLPIMESFGNKYKHDFHLAYSPERINPGDKSRRFESILKIVSADDEKTLALVSAIYGQVVEAGVFEASSIKVAEAAKVIENVQRDVNIALMNELAILFGEMGIDTTEVLEAAGTKWNFIKLSPGLVGGHCIGVDPYYLTHKAEQLGYHPQIITSGRRINDYMPKYIAEQTIKKLIEAGSRVRNSKVLVLGVTFKEDVPDTRNSKVKDLIDELTSYSCSVSALDPHVSQTELQTHFGVDEASESEIYDAVILAVPHRDFFDSKKLQLLLRASGSKIVLIDVKSCFPLGTFDENVLHWRL